MVRQTLLCYQIIFHCSWAIYPPRTCGGGWFYVLADLVLCGWVAVSATLKIIPVLKIFRNFSRMSEPLRINYSSFRQMF